MAHCSVLAVTPITEDWIPHYVGPANGLVEGHGGKYLARTSSHQRVEGESATLRIAIEWPSPKTARALMSDPEYVPHLAAQTAGSISHPVLIAGKDDLA